MPTPKLELSAKYMTAPEVRQKLDLSRYQLDIRIERGILPGPTLVDTDGVRYFDEQWLRIGKAVLESIANR